MSSDMDEIVQEFLVESYEALDRLDGDLLALERDPNSPDVLASIFRVMHTIKGTCGFLGFQKLERVAHAAESLLGGLRDGTLAVNPAITSALLSTGDVLRNLLGKIERSGNDGDQDFLHLVDTLERLRSSGGTDAPTHVPATPAAPRKRATAKGDVPKQVILGPARSPGREADPAEKASVAETNIRVDVQVLDNLMTLVGELVLTRNHIMQLTAGSTHDAPLLSAAAAPQRHHVGAAGRRDAHAPATDPHRVGALPAGRARPRDGARQAGARAYRGRRHRARPLDHRGDQGPADAPGPQRRRPRDRGPGRARGGGQARRGHDRDPRLPRGRSGHDRDAGRRPRDRPREGPGPRDRARPDRRGRRQDAQRARHDRADLPARLLDRRQGHEPVGPRRRHGRRQDQRRTDRRQRRGHDRARQRHHLHA